MMKSRRGISRWTSKLRLSVCLCKKRNKTENILGFLAGCTIDLRQDGNLPDIAPILTTYHQDWLLPTADAKITLQQGSVMRISCPGFGFQNEDLRNSEFQETKYVLFFILLYDLKKERSVLNLIF